MLLQGACAGQLATCLACRGIAWRATHAHTGGHALHIGHLLRGQLAHHLLHVSRLLWRHVPHHALRLLHHLRQQPEFSDHIQLL